MAAFHPGSRQIYHSACVQVLAVQTRATIGKSQSEKVAGILKREWGRPLLSPRGSSGTLLWGGHRAEQSTYRCIA